MLVAAVLRPEEREDRELEVVRRPVEQLLDTLVLAVGQPEATVQRFRDEAQGSSVSGAPDGPISRFVAPGS
jgi:hypothetical protein